MLALDQLKEGKVKVIAIILGVICFVSLCFVFSYLNRYNSLSREYQNLQKELDISRQESASLVKKIAEFRDEIAKGQSKISELVSTLDDAGSRQKEAEAQLKIITTERDVLADKLKFAVAQVNKVTEVKKEEGDSALANDEYWSGILREKSELEVEIESFKSLINGSQIKVDELTKDKASLELDLAKFKVDREELERKLEYNERSAANLSMQLYREKKDKNILQEQMNSLKEETESLRDKLKDLMAYKITLEQNLKQAEENRRALQARLEQMGDIIKDKMSSLYETGQMLSTPPVQSASPAGNISGNSAVVLPSIVVDTQSSGANSASAAQPLISSPVVVGQGQRPVAALSSGKIVNVNAENNFVVLDIGENQGVRKGMVFNVFEGSMQVASLKVVQTRANVSAADIVEQSGVLKAGDIVR